VPWQNKAHRKISTMSPYNNKEKLKKQNKQKILEYLKPMEWNPGWQPSGPFPVSNFIKQYTRKK
jgi:hypothetical protein